jgi:hypothetical protein
VPTITVSSAARPGQRLGVAHHAQVVPLIHAVAILGDQADGHHRAGHSRGKVAGNAAQLQRGRDNGQHRRQLRILADPFDKLGVVRNAVGGGVVAAVQKIAPALDLQVARLLHEAGLCSVDDVGAIAPEQQDGHQAHHHGQQGGEGAAAVAQQVAQGQGYRVHA